MQNQPLVLKLHLHVIIESLTKKLDRLKNWPLANLPAWMPYNISDQFPTLSTIPYPAILRKLMRNYMETQL